MKRILIVILFIHIVIFSEAQKELTNICDVRQVNKTFNMNGGQLYYALPRNLIRVAITIEKTTMIKGPYAFYAAKYLNINDGVIGEDDFFFSIKDIKLERISIADTSKFFVVNNVNGLNLPEISLNADGVILSCNGATEAQGYCLQSEPVKYFDERENEFYFTDLGTRPFWVEKTENGYRTKNDTLVGKSATLKTKMEATTEEENAENAADFVRKIRKRRAKVLMGLEGEVNQIDSDALPIMIDELNKLEEQYLELFRGKEIKEEKKYYFDFNPSESIPVEQYILCWFSSAVGITESKPEVKNIDARALLIKAEVIQHLPKASIEVMDKASKSQSAVKYGLYYRLPALTQITLQLKDNLLVQQKFQIAQKGELLALPTEYLTDRNFKILFYPETGALKSVSLNNE